MPNYNAPSRIFIPGRSRNASLGRRARGLSMRQIRRRLFADPILARYARVAGLRPVGRQK